MPRDLYTDADLAPVELRAAVLAGELYPVGDGWASIAVPDLPRLRAASLGATLPHRATVVLDRRSAAWIWGARSRPPDRATVAARTALQVTGIDIRQVLLPETDVASLGPVVVTVPLRTAVDLLRVPGPLRDEDRDAVRGFLAAGLVDVETVRERLGRGHKVPYSRSALRKLARCGGVSPR